MRKTLLYGGALAAACVGLVLFSSCDAEPKFSSLEDCRDWAKAQGFKVKPEAGPIDVALWICEDDWPEVLSVVIRQKGCVSVVAPSKEVQQDLSEMVPWGGLLLWGDPAVIAKLQAAYPSSR